MNRYNNFESIRFPWQCLEPTKCDRQTEEQTDNSILMQPYHAIINGVGVDKTVKLFY